MKKLLIYYGFILSSIMALTSFLNAESMAQIVSASIFFPLFAYFLDLVIPQKQQAIVMYPNTTLLKIDFKKLKASAKKPKNEYVELEHGEVLDPSEVDIDRRLFLKLIASAGAGLFMMSLFTKKTHAAFFGSAPTGPGTVAIKDSEGEVIDPAIKTPTDGYKITEIDDSSTIAYYGFVDKDGAWFIMKEDPSSTPNYSYSKGDSGFAAAWLGRDELSYGYFDAVF